MPEVKRTKYFNTKKTFGDESLETEAYVIFAIKRRDELQKTLGILKNETDFSTCVRREKYELCMSECDYVLGQYNRIFYYCSPESIKKSEEHLRNFYTTVCNFDDYVVEEILEKAINKCKILYSEERSDIDVKAELPDSVLPRLRDENGKPNKLFQISEASRFTEKPAYIKICVLPHHTQEDVIHFVTNKLGKNKFLEDNNHSRTKLRINLKSFVERMLVGALSMEMESSQGVVSIMEELFKECQYSYNRIERIKNYSRKSYLKKPFDKLIDEFEEYRKRNPMLSVNVNKEALDKLPRDLSRFSKEELEKLFSKWCPVLESDPVLFDLYYSEDDQRLHLKY